MASRRNPWLGGAVLGLTGLLAVAGCYNTPVDTSDLALGPAPRRFPSPVKESTCCYEDSLTGGQVFEMYCSYCHNAPSLAERPFGNFRNVAAHMRVRANLTGKEYAKVVEFLRRWHDVPPPNPPLDAGPKRLTFTQPISELKEEAKPQKGGAAQQADGGNPQPQQPAGADGQ
jgi:hypothetical protein